MTVMTVGKNDILDTYFNGATFYAGLVSGATTPTYAASDTLATHPGWTEDTASYSGLNRITMSWNAAASGSKISNVSSFSIIATATIAGVLVCKSQLKTDTTGVLYGASSFTLGDRLVQSGDVLNITVTEAA